MDRHRLAIVIENDDLKELAGPVGTDLEVAVALTHYANGVAHRVVDVLVGNAVLTGVFRDLHPCKVFASRRRASYLATPGNPRADRNSREM